MNSRRHPFFSALCFLSFSGSLIAFACYFWAALFFGKAGHLVVSVTNTRAMDGITPLYFFLFALFYGVSFAGVFQMWRLRRTGFFIYLFSQLAIMALPVFWLSWQAFSATNSIFTGVFLAGYLAFFKILK